MGMDIQPDRLKKLLQEMTDIYSPSGKEEELLEYIESYCNAVGLKPVRQPVSENRFNLIILPERKSDVDLCFIGHVDTVTAFDLEDYGFYEDGDIVSGLGIADMKAGCAAMIEAFTVLASSEQMPSTVGLVLVVGEEEESDGAKTVIREYSFPWAIVAEPTNLMPCLGHYGYLEVMLRTRGKRAHSSMPEYGQNAIESMLKLLLKLSEYAGSAANGLVYNVRELSGFPGGFVVPDACESWLDLHLPPDSRMDGLKADLESLVERAAETIPGLDAYIRFVSTHSGYRISQERPLIKKLRESFKSFGLPWDPLDFRSHSDGNVLWGAGVDSIILGPGRLETAHTPEESVAFSQVEQAARLYLNFARTL